MTKYSPGDALVPHRVTTVTAGAMKTMSVLLDDPNPIHLDTTAVRALGLGDRLINQGPTNLAYIMDMVRRNFPAARLQNFQTRLLSNVFEGDVVTAGGSIESVERRPDGLHIISRVWLDTEEGVRTVDGIANVVIL
ncbi:MaoC family dehydratase [Microbacterium sp. A196]|uniref:MaoC family dehydratase n=1 Tax=Microbacterium sp. A196 TaxID=3457320 RepID=UPI003FD67958